MGIFHRFVSFQVRMCRAFDRAVFGSWSVDGNQDFVARARTMVERSQRVVDVGGGKAPIIPIEESQALQLDYTGVDIDQAELDRAPAGAYTRKIVADITQFRDPLGADLIICQSVLEHVRDNHKAFAGLAAMCRPGGTVVTFCPSRFAVFAILNRLLPERVKRAVLYTVFPWKRYLQGFPAFYDRCTPRAFRVLAADNGFDVVEERHYFVSSYFMFFFPLYLTWRIVTAPLMFAMPSVFCETFSFTMRKREVRS